MNVGSWEGTCGSIRDTSNGTPASDAMASVYAHEIVEAATSPQWNGYYFNDNGEENADRCAWQFGDLLPGSSNANMQLGSKKYKIQLNWKRNTTDSRPGCVSYY